MTYPRPTIRLLLGIASVIPLALMFFIVGTAFVSIAQDRPAGLLAGDERGFLVFFAVCMALGLISLALVVYFIVFIFNSQRVPREHKALWAIVLFLGHAIVLPIFWFVYFWKDAQELTRTTAGSSP